MRFALALIVFAGPVLSEGQQALPFEVIEVPGHKAQAEWHRLRAEPGSPVIFGGQEAYDQLLDTLDPNNPFFKPRPVKDILRLATALSHPEDLLKMKREDYAAFLDRLKEEGNEDALAYFADYDPLSIDAELIGTWPDNYRPADQIISLIDYETNRNVDTAFIAILPTENPWEAAAYLEFGGWNENPLAEYHVAAMRQWYMDYGAEPIVMANDQMELWAPRQPQTRQDALALATDHYHYAGDVVLQGVGTISALAADRQLGTYWYFWWD